MRVKIYDTPYSMVKTRRTHRGAGLCGSKALPTGECMNKATVDMGKLNAQIAQVQNNIANSEANDDLQVMIGNTQLEQSKTLDLYKELLKLLQEKRKFVRNGVTRLQVNSNIKSIQNRLNSNLNEVQAELNNITASMRGAGVGPSKLRCTAGECVEVPGSAPASAVANRTRNARAVREQMLKNAQNRVNSARRITNKARSTLKSRIAELEAEIAQHTENAKARLSKENITGAKSHLRRRAMKQAELNKWRLLEKSA